MKKFNLFNEIIIVNKQELLNAINTNKIFGINIKGEILFEPYKEKEMLIFSAKIEKKENQTALAPSKPISLNDIFGKNYQVVEDEDRVLIKAFSNWQEIINLNVKRASYDDTTGDGVDKFSNPILEDIGWKATDFDIKYRAIVEHLEENCEGTLLCIEQEEPSYQFSGLGFLEDDEEAKKVMYNYCQTIVKKMVKEDPLFAKENLDDDEEEAARFFEAI
jgi:hypothetical protein